MKRITAVAILVMLVAAAGFAYGGGGFFRGSHYQVPEYSNMNRPAEISGGYGYGAAARGSRFGGFGLSIHDTSSEELVGAFGGVISGTQYRTGPVTLSLNLWSGFGYVNPDVVDTPVGAGYFIEANVEAGFAILPWFQLALYSGMQAIGSFDPSELISSARYTPVVGTRFTWGSF